MLCYAMPWYGMVCYGVVWYGMVCYAMLRLLYDIGGDGWRVGCVEEEVRG